MKPKSQSAAAFRLTGRIQASARLFSTIAVAGFSWISLSAVPQMFARVKAQ